MILESQNPSRTSKKANLNGAKLICYATLIAAALFPLSGSQSAEPLNPPTNSTTKTLEAVFQPQSLILNPQDLKDPIQDRLTIAGRSYLIRVESIKEIEVEGYLELDTKNIIYWRRNPDQTLRVSKLSCSTINQAVLEINEQFTNMPPNTQFYTVPDGGNGSVGVVCSGYHWSGSNSGITQILLITPRRFLRTEIVGRWIGSPIAGSNFVFFQPALTTMEERMFGTDLERQLGVNPLTVVFWDPKTNTTSTVTYPFKIIHLERSANGFFSAIGPGPFNSLESSPTDSGFFLYTFSDPFNPGSNLGVNSLSEDEVLSKLEKSMAGTRHSRTEHFQVTLSIDDSGKRVQVTAETNLEGSQITLRFFDKLRKSSNEDSRSTFKINLDPQWGILSFHALQAETLTLAVVSQSTESELTNPEIAELRNGNNKILFIRLQIEKLSRLQQLDESIRKLIEYSLDQGLSRDEIFARVEKKIEENCNVTDKAGGKVSTDGDSRWWKMRWQDGDEAIALLYLGEGRAFSFRLSPVLRSK